MRQADTVVILAGGDGDRFRPLTGKYLFPFIGKPLLRHVCDSMMPYGKKLAVIVAPGQEDMIRAVVPPGTVIVTQHKQEGGMGDAILACKRILKGSVIIIGNDVFDESVIGSILDKADSHHAGVVLTAYKPGTYFPGGYLMFRDGNVAGIVEKPGAGNEPSPWVTLVADYVADIDDFITELEKTESSDSMFETALSSLMGRTKADYVAYEGEWNAPKYPWNVLSLSAHFLSKTHRHVEAGCQIDPTAVITGDVYLGKNVRVGAYSKIAGPAYIGEDTVIADYAMVRESHIGNSCLIGSSTEVARSYLADRVSLHRNYVGDSVLGEGVLMGAGAVTANFRFDAKNVSSYVAGKKIDTGHHKLGAIVGANAHIGVNVTILPGIKIGAKATVGPGEVIVKDIPDESVIFTNRT